MPVGIVFFDNALFGLIGGIVSCPLFFRALKKREKSSQKVKLEKQFCRALETMRSSMAAGETFENTIKGVAYGDFTEDMSIIKEKFAGVDRMVCLNCDITEAFSVFASKSGSREISCFSVALESVLTAGGDVIELLGSSADMIRKKYEAKEEIKNCIAEPKLSHRIMTLMPVVLIFIMRMMAPDYVEKLYSGAGRIVMISMLAVLIAAWLIGEKIGDIKI